MTTASRTRFQPPPALGPGPLTAVLGATNTGKTHFALERMLAHSSGMIGLPLRLLAREVYDKVVAAKGARAVALVTGEEKIVPASPRYWVCTVEAMPLEIETAFLAVDEVQLAADRERGRIFTSRLLHARGTEETLLLGASTMRPIIRQLFPRATFLERTRFSQLSHAGYRKVTRLPRRSVAVAFSADDVYAIAELIRRQRGGAAVVLGALSPRTRNAQAELYQSGDVDYLVATDAIGMGLNMDIDHVAFSARRKFDGRGPRNLGHAELAQIAGRAGRHVRDGTFGTTSDCPPFDDDAVFAIEENAFEPVRALQWRSEALDFHTLPALLHSLETPPPGPEFVRARGGDDEGALRRLVDFHDIAHAARGGAALKLLWEVCQTPDFRKVTPDQHARLLAEIYRQLIGPGAVAESWLAPLVERLDNTAGDVDALSARIAHIRTWTYLSHRAGWLENGAYWQSRAREIEDSLSDALHEKLTQRFIDRRTSVLLRKLKDDAPLLAGVTPEGDVIVEGEFVGRLLGFQFILDPRAKGPHARAVQAAATKALRPVMATRAATLVNARDDELKLRDGGLVWWRDAIVARLAKGPAPLRPNVVLTAADFLPPRMIPRVQDRIETFLANAIEGSLTPLLALQKAVTTTGPDAIDGLARGVGYRLVENFGAISRALVGEDLRNLAQEDRGKLRKLGVRFGEYSVFVPALLKPAPARMLTLLWALHADRDPGDFPPPKAGLTSVPLNPDLPHAYYYAAGFRPSKSRAVRVDMLERLADFIRTARETADMREGFEATTQMMSLVGCSGEDFEAILASLGFRKNVITRRVPVNPPQEAPAQDARRDEGESGSEAPEASEAPAPAADAAKAEAAPEADAPQPEAAAATQPPEAPATAPESEASAPASASEDTSPAAEEAAAPASAPSASPASSPEAAPEGAAPEDAAPAPEVETVEVEVTLWKSAPRKPKSARRGPPRKGAQAGEGNQEHPRKPGRGPQDRQRNDGKGPRKPRKGGKAPRRDEGPRRFEARPPRREKKADPDSPFAVLAALKADMGRPGNGSKDES